MYISQVIDATKWEAFEENFKVIVTHQEDHRKGSMDNKQKKGIVKEGTGRHEPSFLSLPEIYDVQRDRWDKHKFDEYSGLDVISIPILITMRCFEIGRVDAPLSFKVS